MRKHKNRDEETKQNTNIIQIKFNGINQIHKTNANELSQLLQIMYSVKVHSNALEIVQSNQSP